MQARGRSRGRTDAALLGEGCIFARQMALAAALRSRKESSGHVDPGVLSSEVDGKTLTTLLQGLVGMIRGLANPG
jgi:hypothetical protein